MDGLIMAPRKRSSGPDWLPSRVYMGKSAFEYHPAKGGGIRLGKLDEPKEIILSKYNALIALIEEPTGSFSQLTREYFAGASYARKKPRTKKDYANHCVKVCKTFGNTNKHRIKPHHIRQYMDKRGVKSEVQANREHSFMSAVYSWAYQNGKVNINPCKGVSKFTEHHRERYIEHWEYNAVLAEAMDKWILLAAAMEISYCCAARQSDVWDLERNQLRKEGIFIQQGKTGAKQIKLWNPRLKAAVDLALSVSKVTSFKHLFCDVKGNHPAQGTLRNWYCKAKAEAQLKHNGEWVNDFTFHDIKAKSMSDYDSDYDGNLQKFSGHKTEAQAQSYSRKIKLSPTLK